jgi:signal transduction histidine kinase
MNHRYLNFNVSARTARLIGRENFANAEGAIVELVKNTYDADSMVCFVVFDIREDKHASSIFIIDCGEGMTEDVILKHWMTIGTDDKLNNAFSRNGRVKSGAKGIGRFALDRLGKKAEMITFSNRTKQGLLWTIDWTDFEKEGYTLADINASLESIDYVGLRERVEGFGLHHFDILGGLFTDDYKGTIIKISNLNDDWDDNQLRNLNTNLENLFPPHLSSDFEIYLYSFAAPELFGKVKSANYDDFDYRVEAFYPEEGHVIKVKLWRNELNVSLLESEYKEVFGYDTMKSFPYRLEDFKSNPVTIDVPINSSIEDKRLKRLGSFRFVFYFVKNTANDDGESFSDKKYPYNSVDSAYRKNWLKKFRGIKIYRDNFRVRPYGEDGNDWLGLGERQGRSPGGPGQKLGGYRVRPNQISGSVFISRLQNAVFEDKSSREGIQENDDFALFKNLLLTIIGSFETDRNTIMYNLSLLYKKNHPIDGKAKEISDRVNEESKNKEKGKNDTSEPTNEEVLAAGYSSLENELNDKEDEIRLLRGLASSGIAIASFTHELKSLSNRLLPRTEMLVKLLNDYISSYQLNGVDKYDNPYYHIELIREEDNKLHQWLNYTLTTVKKDKRERHNIVISDYFTRFKQTWEEALKGKSIKIHLDGDAQLQDCVRGFEMDLDSIFNNFVTNSVVSLLRTPRNDKQITISWKSDHGYMVIDFEDNGMGLAEEYKAKPEVIFNAFETSTVNKDGEKTGTGMGLFIVKGIIDGYKDSSINITKIDNGFGLRVIFKCSDYGEKQ